MHVPSELREVAIKELRIVTSLASFLRQQGITQVNDFRRINVGSLAAKAPSPRVAAQLVSFARRVERCQVSLKADPTLREQTSGPFSISEHARQFSVRPLPISPRLRLILFGSGIHDLAELDGLLWEDFWPAPGAGEKVITELHQLFQRIEDRELDHLRGLHPVPPNEFPWFIDRLVRALPVWRREFLGDLFSINSPRFRTLEQAALHLETDPDHLQAQLDETIFELVRRGRERLNTFAEMFSQYCQNFHRRPKLATFLDWVGLFLSWNYHPEFYFRILSENPETLPLAKPRSSRFAPKPGSLG